MRDLDLAAFIDEFCFENGAQIWQMVHKFGKWRKYLANCSQNVPYIMESSYW